MNSTVREWTILLLLMDNIAPLRRHARWRCGPAPLVADATDTENKIIHQKKQDMPFTNDPGHAYLLRNLGSCGLEPLAISP